MPLAPSLRALRSNPDCLRGKTLDCFAALAMTMWRLRALTGMTELAVPLATQLKEARLIKPVPGAWSLLQNLKLWIALSARVFR